MATDEVPNNEFCVKNAEYIVTTGYYRFSLAISLAVSIISSNYLIYFFYKHYKKLIFHFNIKVLLFSLFLCCFVYGCLNTGMKVHYLFLSFFYSKPCQLFIPTALYISIHLPVVFVLFIAQFIQMAMVTERFIATVYVRTYEFGYRKLGPLLLIGALAGTVTVMIVLYQHEKFNGLYLNARVLPSGTAPVANKIIMIMLCVNLLALVCTIALRFINNRRLIKSTLSSTYQSKENRTTSILLFWIASIQFATFVLTDVISLCIRVFLAQSKYITAFKENADLFNFYTIFLPAFTTIYYSKLRQQRIGDIRNNLNIKAIGSEGWKNYSAMTQERWK